MRERERERSLYGVCCREEGSEIYSSGIEIPRREGYDACGGEQQSQEVIERKKRIEGGESCNADSKKRGINSRKPRRKAPSQLSRGSN